MAYSELFPQKSLQLFSLGGQVHCSSRWKQTLLAPDSFRFYWHKGHFWIGLGSENARVMIEHNDQKQDLKSIKLAVNAGENSQDGNVNRLILGRTYYQVAHHCRLNDLKTCTQSTCLFYLNNH